MKTAASGDGRPLPHGTNPPELRPKKEKPKRPARHRQTVGPRWLTDFGVEADYGLKHHWLRKSRVEMKKGKLSAGPPYTKAGFKVLYRRDAVEDWLRAREVGG
jgi:hypothetical protein